MDFLTEEGQSYSDFKLIHIETIEELDIVLREIIHLPTGANVMHLENEDPENLFCLSFKTIPDSSNGAPHILEHTALCGSRKYPVKDPFFSMNRRSLNTFMNALTGSDFTCYPASTQVEKDFYNLLEVYIDAVFHPLLKEESFLQEGHRLEFQTLDDSKSPLEYRGIVYNEMKGAMSSADSRIHHKLMELVVPDLTYAYNSGGDPNEIPNLSYKDLVEFHDKFYHPSHCLFYFYGNLPLKKHLDFIAEKALKNVPKTSPISGIGHQKRFEKPKREIYHYPINEDEPTEKKYIQAFCWLTCPLLNQEEVLALAILDSVLMDTDASLLKKMLLDTNLCIQAESYLDSEMTEVPFMMICRGLEEDSGEKLEKVLFDSLKKIAQEGIPYDQIEASIHQLEFSRLEITGDHNPFGLTLFMRCALGKQHGAAPANALKFHSLIEGILEKSKDLKYFSPLIEKYFLKNPHFVSLKCVPDPQLAAKEVSEEKEKLAKIKESLSEKEVAKILENSKMLKEYQQIIEGQKLRCLPKVGLEDVPKETKEYPLKDRSVNEQKVLQHDIFTNHIVYADLVFDLPELTEDELFDLQLYILLWPELGMGKRDYKETLEFLHAKTGGLGAHLSLHVQANDGTKMNPSLQVHGKSLGRNTKYLFEGISDMVLSPRLDEKRRIKELLNKLHNALESRLTRNSMRYASQLALEGFSLPSHINEKWHGLSFYNYIHKHYQNVDHVIEKMHALKNKLLYSGEPQLVLACDDDLFDEIQTTLPTFAKKQQGTWKGNYQLPLAKNHARIISSPVAFSAYGFKAVGYTHEDAPALQVSTLLLENKVLHHRIREEGGAYGSGASYNPVWGNFYFYAYRDPHIAHTYRAFKDSIFEIGDGNFDAADLEQAKLGIIQHLDAPITPGNRAMAGFILDRDGKTTEMRKKYREKILNLQAKDVQSALKNHLENQIEKAIFVTFAGKELIDRELDSIEDKKLEILPIIEDN